MRYVDLLKHFPFKYSHAIVSCFLLSPGNEALGGASSGTGSGLGAVSGGSISGGNAGGAAGGSGGVASIIRSGINRMVGQNPPGHTEKTTLLSSDDEFQ